MSRPTSAWRLPSMPVTTLRPDLRMVAMSATAATAKFRPAPRHRCDRPPLSPPVAPIRSTSAGFPCLGHDRVERAAADAVRGALRDEPGDVLVFLPGIGEITAHRRPPTASVPAESTCPARRRPVRRGAGPRLGAVAAGSPPRRARHRHRRDVAHRRGRARRRRQRTAVAAPRHRHRNDPADVTVGISRDSADQRPGVPGAPSPASPTACGRRSSTARARRTARPRSSTSTSADSHSNWPRGEHHPAAAFADPPPPRAWRQRSSCSGCSERSSRGVMPSGRHASPTSVGDGAAPAAPAAGAHRRRRPAGARPV